MTDQEIDALAHHATKEAVETVHEMAPSHSSILTLPTGEICLKFGAVSEIGGIEYLYNPMPAVRLLVDHKQEFLSIS